MIKLPFNDSRAVFGKNECIYKRVLDDFQNTKFIGIMTFNISPKDDSELLKSLKNACTNGTSATIITNIPKRFKTYHNHQYANSAKQMIDSYMQLLNPQDYEMRLNTYFNFNNHAKIVMTDNIIYWGSSNFSDESCNNIECGTLSKDKNLIKFMKDSFFPSIQSKSIPYYKYNFAVAIANLDSLILTCIEAKESLFYATFEPCSDYCTNFKEEWLYRKTDSGLTPKFLQEFIKPFSQFSNALNELKEIIDECWENDESMEQIQRLDNVVSEYTHMYRNFCNTISSLVKELENVAKYDVTDEACDKITEDYCMLAYDEDFDYYADKAMDEAIEEYESLIEDTEPTVHDALNYLDSMVEYFEQLKTSLYQLLEVNSKIDNTDI